VVVATLLTAGIPVVGSQIAQSLLTPRVRFPKVAPGEFLRLALDIQALEQKGLTPVLSVDPFTQATVLSTADQSPVLFNLLGESFARESLRGTPAESSAIFRAREELIESRRQFPVFPGSVGEETTPRDVVTQALTTTTAKVVAPGVVDRKTSSLVRSRRLGGPCAGLNTGFSRVNCARGGDRERPQ